MEEARPKMNRSRSRSREYSRSRSSSSRGETRHRKRDGPTDNDRRRRTNKTVKPLPEKKCIGVFGMSKNTSEDKIYEIFGKFGEIKRINIIYDTKTGQSRGYCFIYYKRIEDAVDAKETCDQMEIDHRRIRVDFSITNRPHEPTPGVYKGRSTREEEKGAQKRRSHSRSRS